MKRIHRIQYTRLPYSSPRAPPHKRIHRIHVYSSPSKVIKLLEKTRHDESSIKRPGSRNVLGRIKQGDLEPCPHQNCIKLLIMREVLTQWFGSNYMEKT
jgi:hypothetical protein